MVSKLPNDKAGELFKHILEYVNDQNPNTNDIIIQIAFEPIKQSLKRDLKRYEAMCLKNRENALIRWDKENATVCDRMRSDTKHADSDIDSDIDSDKDIEIGKEEKKEKTNKNCLFKNSGITIELIQEAFNKADDLINADPEHYYNSALDWSDSNGKVKKDWIATIRGFARRDAKQGKLIIKKIESKEHFESLKARDYNDLSYEEREQLSIYKMKYEH